MAVSIEMKEWYELVKARKVLEKHNINSLGQITAIEQQLKTQALGSSNTDTDTGNGRNNR